MLGTSAAAEILGVSRDTVSKWCRDGVLDAEHDGEGRPWRISESEVERMKKIRSGKS